MDYRKTLQTYLIDDTLPMPQDREKSRPADMSGPGGYRPPTGGKARISNLRTDRKKISAKPKAGREAPQIASKVFGDVVPQEAQSASKGKIA